jgi:hypothetical protein
MTKEQQRIAIAETCGWKWERLWTGELHGKPVGEQGPFREVPDYLNDLNAMHEAEKTLNQKLAAEYARMLTSIAWQSDQPTFAPMTATAAQRAEAFLRTIEKWATLTQTEQTKL